MIHYDGDNSTDTGFIYFDAFQGDEAIFATQLFQLNATQHVPYCFEFKFARINPKNLTNEDFGKIEVWAYAQRIDRQQLARNRPLMKQDKLKLFDTILPNSTYPADRLGSRLELLVNFHPPTFA